MKISKTIKILILTTIYLGLVACSDAKLKEENNDTQEQITKAYLSDSSKNTIEENLKTFTEGTAFEGAEFKIELDKNDLKISVIKPITDIMTSYNTITADDTVEAIKKSLVFDDAYDSIVEETGMEFDCMQVFIFNGNDELNNNDYYTLKTVM